MRQTIRVTCQVIGWYSTFLCIVYGNTPGILIGLVLVGFSSKINPVWVTREQSRVLGIALEKERSEILIRAYAAGNVTLKVRILRLWARVAMGPDDYKKLSAQLDRQA